MRIWCRSENADLVSIENPDLAPIGKSRSNRKIHIWSANKYANRISPRCVFNGNGNMRADFRAALSQYKPDWRRGVHHDTYIAMAVLVGNRTFR